MDNKSFVSKLKRLNACGEAVEWVKEHGGTSAECWRDCERGDWMAWLAEKTPTITKRQLVGALADCAALSLKYYEAKYPDDKRVRDCIDTCRRYAKGKATDSELAKAAYASSASACASYDAVACASSAASAASAAYASACASSVYAASASSVYVKANKRCANILRKHFQDMLT